MALRSSPSALLAWATAPDWLDVAHAAALLGQGYTAAMLEALVDLGAVVAEEDAGSLRIEARSLAEFQEALKEITQ